MNAHPLPPVIVVGMHRSGTTMITRMLAEAGLYVGRGEMAHWEAPFFQQINNLVLRQVDGRWDNPDAVPYLLQNGEVCALIADYIRYLLKTRHAISFLGWRGYLHYRDVARLDVPWGWKDPRNTITLPFWLDVFPEARVIHIVRHGVDAASSLSTRYKNKFRLTVKQEQFWRYWLRPKLGRFTNSKVSQVSLDFCFALWEKYLRSAREHLQDLDQQMIEIKYEEFLQCPFEKLQLLADFCRLSPGTQIMAELATGVQADRAYSYRSDPQLVEFADSVADRLAVYGY